MLWRSYALRTNLSSVATFRMPKAYATYPRSEAPVASTTPHAASSCGCAELRLCQAKSNISRHVRLTAMLYSAGDYETGASQSSQS